MPAPASTSPPSRPLRTGDWLAIARRSARPRRSIAATFCQTCPANGSTPTASACASVRNKSLNRLVLLFEEERAFGDAIEAAQQLLRLDPLDELAWCALMRCHARRGERAAGAARVPAVCSDVEEGARGSAERGDSPDLSRDPGPRRRGPCRIATPRTGAYPLVGRAIGMAGAPRRLARRRGRPAAAGPDPRRSGHRQDEAGRRARRLVHASTALPQSRRAAMPARAAWRTRQSPRG